MTPLPRNGVLLPPKSSNCLKNSRFCTIHVLDLDFLSSQRCTNRLKLSPSSRLAVTNRSKCYAETELLLSDRRSLANPQPSAALILVCLSQPVLSVPSICFQPCSISRVISAGACSSAWLSLHPSQCTSLPTESRTQRSRSSLLPPANVDEHLRRRKRWDREHRCWRHTARIHNLCQKSTQSLCLKWTWYEFARRMRHSVKGRMPPSPVSDAVSTVCSLARPCDYLGISFMSGMFSEVTSRPSTQMLGAWMFRCRRVNLVSFGSACKG